jgi:hypothetical protein
LPACNTEKTGGPDIGYIVRNKSFIDTLQLFPVVTKHWYLYFKLQGSHQCFAAHQIYIKCNLMVRDIISWHYKLTNLSLQVSKPSGFSSGFWGNKWCCNVDYEYIIWHGEKKRYNKQGKLWSIDQRCKVSFIRVTIDKIPKTVENETDTLLWVKDIVVMIKVGICF